MVAAPGGGKGTQGERLAAKSGIRHVSSAEVLRGEVGAGAGRGIAVYRDRGFLVEANGGHSPDSITADIQARLPR